MYKMDLSVISARFPALGRSRWNERLQFRANIRSTCFGHIMTKRRSFSSLASHLNYLPKRIHKSASDITTSYTDNWMILNFYKIFRVFKFSHSDLFRCSWVLWLLYTNIWMNRARKNTKRKLVPRQLTCIPVIWLLFDENLTRAIFCNTKDTFQSVDIQSLY